jgi:hypothetical protein
MGFLDKVKETSKQMGEKAQQLAEVGQEKFDDFKTDKQITAIKEQIGALVYRVHTGGAPADADAQIAALVGEISAAEAAKAKAEAAATDPPESGGGS